jgi:hypothetical protein
LYLLKGWEHHWRIEPDLQTFVNRTWHNKIDDQIEDDAKYSDYSNKPISEEEREVLSNKGTDNT